MLNNNNLYIFNIKNEKYRKEKLLLDYMKFKI